MSCVTFHIVICTCARAHPISVSQKRLDQSRSNLLCGWEPVGYEAFTCHGSHFTLRFPRAHVHTHICSSGTAWPIAFKFVVHLWPNQLWPNQFARWAVCAVGGLRGLRDWRFARLAVYAIGGLRGGRFARLAFGGWRFVFGGFAFGVWRFAFDGLRFPVCGWWFAVDDWRLAVWAWRCCFTVGVWR